MVVVVYVDEPVVVVVAVDAVDVVAVEVVVKTPLALCALWIIIEVIGYCRKLS